jgi:ADP-heptose:LPS heptosyltransferase
MNLPDPFAVRNILIVQMHNHIGDTICGLPMYAALKELYPKADITLVAAVKPYPIPLRELNPMLDHILYYDKSSLGSIFRFYRMLRKKKFDIGIVPPSIKLSRTAHIINWFSGAVIRAGANAIDGVPNPTRGLLNLRGDFYWTRNEVSQVERHLDIVRLLGVEVPQAAYDAARLQLTPDEIAEAVRFVDESFPVGQGPLIVLQPGAGTMLRTWDVENFILLIHKLDAEFHARFVLNAGPIDGAIIDRIRSACPSIPFALLTSPYKRIAGVLAQSDLFITNDTGPMHIGGSVGARMVTILGPTKAHEWSPRGTNILALESPSGNINDIGVDVVFGACRELLATL